MKRSRRSLCQIHMLFCRDFTGATGLEPATSVVTGRSQSCRTGRGSAGITGASRAFQPLPCGVRRAPAGASGDLLRDERGMLRCLSGKRTGTARDALVVLVATASVTASSVSTLAQASAILSTHEPWILRGGFAARRTRRARPSGEADPPHHPDSHRAPGDLRPARSAAIGLRAHRGRRLTRQLSAQGSFPNTGPPRRPAHRPERPWSICGSAMNTSSPCAAPCQHRQRTFPRRHGPSLR
jgi:hypothetical protein